jgi:peptidoglycan/LPS O-acetylase OafA/YrhL
MKNSVKHVELLDHLRGVAIIAVLLLHTVAAVFGYDALPWNGWFRGFSGQDSFLFLLPFSVVSAGVPIFFVVSGFCIHMSFQNQGQRWGDFFIRRIFRIYPAYLAALIFFVLLDAEHSRWNFHGQDWLQVFTHLFLLQNFNPLTMSGINGSFWSLAIEAQLYLLYPALLFGVARLGWHRTMIILAVCEVLIRGTDGLVQTADATNSVGGQISWLFANSPLGYWFSWSLGAFIADAFLKNQPLPFAKTSPVWWLGLAITSYFVKPLDPFRFILFAVTTAIVTSKLLSRAASETKAPSSALAILKKTGLWSYSIYLLHQPLLNIYFSAMDWLVPEEHRTVLLSFLLTAVAWLAIIPFSILWYKVFELPGIALGKRIIRKGGATDRPNRMKAITALTVGALLVIAVGNFLVSAKLTPPEPVEANNLAWSLATSPDATKRNGALAVKLAEDACLQTQCRITAMVGTLAAAYAEAGRFDEAIFTAQQACKLAEKNGETNLLQINQKLLALYQNHQPYRDTLSTKK